MYKRQAYFGLAGLLIVGDAAEAALNLPTGAQDIPLVIQDLSLIHISEPTRPY